MEVVGFHPFVIEQKPEVFELSPFVNYNTYLMYCYVEKEGNKSGLIVIKFDLRVIDGLDKDLNMTGLWNIYSDYTIEKAVI